MKSKQSREYFQDIKPKVDFKKLMARIKQRGYLFYRPAKEKGKDEEKK